MPPSTLLHQIKTTACAVVFSPEGFQLRGMKISLNRMSRVAAASKGRDSLPMGWLTGWLFADLRTPYTFTIARLA